ncbi:MurT ligase domain-containing protein, partial [Gleimia europaea]
WQESLTMLDPQAALVVGVNGQRADGTDLSWLWDVDFDKLAGARVWATGERGADLQVRLRYAGVDAQYADTPLQGLDKIPGGRVDMLLNYTSFRDTRAELIRKGLMK